MLEVCVLTRPCSQFSKYRVHKSGNLATDKRTDAQVEK